MRPLAVATFGLLALASAISLGADAPGVYGLWIHHDKFDRAPADLYENDDVHEYANAAMVNFCPHGEFRLATGVVYQSTRSPSVQIGASDGLAIYSGHWSRDGDIIRVEYRLVDAEFANLLQDPAASAVRTGELHFIGDRLQFRFTTKIGRTWPFMLTASGRYPKKLIDEFVECQAKPH